MTASTDRLLGIRVAFVGKLGGMSRRDAAQLVRQHGGQPVDASDGGPQLVVVGADQLPPAEGQELLSESQQQQATRGQLEVLSETAFYQRLGYAEPDANLGQLATPAMLAELLGVPINIIRRWRRKGLIVPAREIHSLPYFDFQEIATARNLAQLLAAGESPAAIERKLERLSRFLPDVERPLAQLSVIINGRELLLRQGEGLVEPGGQLRFDFESLDAQEEDEPAATLRIENWAEQLEVATPDEMVQYAAQLEDEGELELAAEAYRASLAAGGPRPDTCFLLAELLYRLGEVQAARERYYNVIELDESVVEARHNLGCILAETGQPELAIAAFQGALAVYPDYPDAHYQLARTLDDLQRHDEAAPHWEAFLSLAPGSPWADEARDRLQC